MQAADPVDDYRGEIHQYVGDEMAITWLDRDGRPGGRPIGCFTAIEAALEAAASDSVRDFGVAPRVRGALHFGPVVVGEVGERKRDIVFHGDVMNTTSRLEQMARELNRSLVVSADAWRRLLDPDQWTVEDLGTHVLRGRASPLQLYAVTTGRPGAEKLAFPMRADYLQTRKSAPRVRAHGFSSSRPVAAATGSITRALEGAPQHLPGARDYLRRARAMTELGMMLLSRVRIALRVGLPALQRRLPDPWDVHPDSRDVSQGANLAVLFYEIFLNQTAQGLQLTTADALGRYFVLGIPSRHRRTEETAFMVFCIFTAHPTGENPFGWNRVAAGKTTVHANIVRSQTVEASDLEAMVSDRIEARLDQGVVALELRYRRGVPNRVASEGRVRFAAESEHVRVYRADELVDVVKSVPAAIDRLERFGLRVTLPELTDIFDGSEQVVNLTVQPWFLRRVYAPSGG